MRKTLLAATALGSTVMFLVPGALAFDWNGPYIGGLTGVVKSTGSIDWSFSSDFLGTTTGAFDFDGLGLLAGSRQASTTSSTTSSSLASKAMRVSSG